MNIEIITNSFQESQIRTVIIDNEPWFIAKDVANILGYTTDSAMSNAKKDLLADELKTSFKMKSKDNRAKLYDLLSESGLYSLIMRSRKQVAKPFQKWVTREVLPSIRKTGSYSLTEQPKEKTRDDLISVSDSELDRELKALDFLLSRVHFSEKEKIEFINKTLEKINFQTLENPHLLKHEPVFTLTQLLKDFGIDIRTADFNRKLESFGVIQRFGNGWILLDMKFGENRHFKEGTNHRYYKSTFQELLDLVLK
jgi:prophage antirepressor-like protein